MGGGPIFECRLTSIYRGACTIELVFTAPPQLPCLHGRVSLFVQTLCCERLHVHMSHGKFRSFMDLHDVPLGVTKDSMFWKQIGLLISPI